MSFVVMTGYKGGEKPLSPSDPKRYEDVSHVFDDFHNYLYDRRVDQECEFSVDLADRECGCCVGAHLARFFGQGLHGVDVKPVRLDEWSVCQFVPSNIEWARSYLDWRKKCNPDEDYDIDGWEGISPSRKKDGVYEWMRETGRDNDHFHAYHYQDGIKGLMDLLNLDVSDMGNFSIILSNLAHPGGYVQNAWSEHEWGIDQSDISHALAVATIANLVHMEQFEDWDIGRFCVSMTDPDDRKKEGTPGFVVAERVRKYNLEQEQEDE